MPAGNRDPGLALRCSHPSADRLSPGRATVALPPVSSYVAIIYYGSQGDLRTVEMLIRALPCVRAAPNSQGWGPKYPVLCHLCGGSARRWRCRSADTNSQGWGPQDPRGLLAHLAPHVALRPCFLSGRLCPHRPSAALGASFGVLHVLAHPPDVVYWRHLTEGVARPATRASAAPWSQSYATSVSHLLA